MAHKNIFSLRWWHIALLYAVGLGLGIACMLYLSHAVLRYWPLGVDFYPRWVGSRAFWNGASPYDPSIEIETHRLVFGSAALGNDIYLAYSYPAYLAIFLLPLLGLPVELSALLWSAAMWAILFVSVLLWSIMLKPPLSPLLWGVVILSGLLYRPALLAVLNGQYALFVLGCFGLAWLLLMRNHDLLAGVALVGATIKPSVGLLLPIVLMLWAFRQKRWNLIAGFCGALLLLTLFSFWRIGWWVGDFLTQSASYTVLNRGSGMPWSLENLFSLAGIGWALCAVSVFGIGLRELWRVKNFPWLAVIGALNVTLIVSPHTLEYDLTILLIPLLWFGAFLREAGLSLWLFVALIWFPWYSWLATLAFGEPLEIWWGLIWQTYPILVLICILGGLAYTRRQARSGLAIEIKT